LIPLKVAEGLGMRSISFPAPGTGVGGFPLEEAAEVMIKSILDHISRSGSLMKVRLVLYDDRALGIFQQVYERTVAWAFSEKALSP
jgi:O-acetyl-ADP-ribose deacetylase (regulator of RNase III)